MSEQPPGLPPTGTPVHDESNGPPPPKTKDNQKLALLRFQHAAPNPRRSQEKDHQHLLTGPVPSGMTCGFWDNVLVAKGYRPVDRDQVFLLPPNLRDWLPAGHRVWFVLDIVDQLDLSALHAVSKRGGVGRAGYHPDVLVAVLIYAYMHGLLSSRGIERACTSDVAYMVACGRDVPDHTVIARFRQVHQAALKTYSRRSWSSA